MEIIQELFNDNFSGTLKLPPDEYKGPLIVNRSCVIDGGRSTLWAERGPALIITAPNVFIKNLHIDITGQSKADDNFVAIKTSYSDTALENVEVNGRVIGFPGEPENWRLPKSISLGEFAAGRRNTFNLALDVPAAARITCKVSGLELSAGTLHEGPNSLLLTTHELDSNVIIYGEIVIKTSVVRKIYVWGKALEGAPMSDMLPRDVIVDDLCDAQEDPPDSALPTKKNPSVQSLQRGQRIFAEELHSPQIKIVYEHQDAPRDIVVDAYCFMLGRGGTVTSDNDLIFFRNTEAADRSVRISEEPTAVSVELDKVSPRFDKIVVCFSIYGNSESHHFAVIDEPVIRLFGGGLEYFRLELTELANNKTFIGAELYRYKGKWKIKAVGMGTYSGPDGKTGVKQLCDMYGVST